MSLPRAVRVIRDPIHGNINIYPTEEPILNSVEFQRLRFIAQVSLCSLVYPSAVHNRFSHSLGAMHLAGEMYRAITHNAQLPFDTNTFLAVRLAAMIHDIGHGPFSHIFERGVAFFNSQTKNKIPQPFSHEEMGLKIIDELLHDKIHESIRELVLKLVEGKDMPNDQWWLAQIIASEVDSDRSDFLLRDSYFAGVSYGNYEVQRLLETMTVAELPTGQAVMVFKDKGLMAIESFLFARYNMYRGVYFHHTNLIGDAMISRAVFELIRRDLYPRVAITDPREFVKWNDTRLYGIFHDLTYTPNVNFPDDPVFTTITGIIFRRLWKRLMVSNIPLAELRGKIGEFARDQGVNADLISEIITVKKLPYSWVPYHFEGDKPTTIYICDGRGKLYDLTEVSQIQVPANFMLNKQVLVHPDFIEPLSRYLGQP